MSEEEDPEPPSLEKRQRQAGQLPGNRYVRIVRPNASDFRRSAGHYIATEEMLRARGLIGRAYESVRRVLLGDRLESEAEIGERLSKKTGLAVIASDNISSSAYATEEAMRVLALAGAGALVFTMPIAIAVCVVLAIVVFSQSHVIRAYPNGGGSYAVAKDNLGPIPSLVAASALLIDYVLTVAVSIAAGVAAISSFVPAVHGDRVVIALVLIAVLAVGNLRGIREAGVLFAAPTYVYVVAMYGLIAFGLFRIFSGEIIPAAAPHEPFDPAGVALLTPFLLLRAFSSGAVGLTGSEAVANAVPSFKPDERRNAIVVLVLMGTFFATIFVGLTYLATTIGIAPDLHEFETVNSMLTRSIVGDGTPFYYLVQIATAVLLLLAANTAFTGFPRLASVLANDRFMPRQFVYRGERLAFSFGIVVLAAVAGIVLTAFDGSVTALIPLYTVGVFLAFTMSQSGLVRRWWRQRPRGWRVGIALNGFGTLVTGGMLLIVGITKFATGAWMVFVVLPLLVLLLYGINLHYRRVHDALVLPDLSEPLPSPEKPVVIVPVARLDRASLQAIQFARSISSAVRAVHIATSAESASEFQRRWEAWGSGLPLDVIESPYRSLVQPLLRYIEAIDKGDDRPITVVLAEFVPRHWWEFILHSQTAFRLKASLLFRPNTVVVDVPYHFHSQG